MSVASGRWGDPRNREAVGIPPGVWSRREPVVETTIFSDRFDITISLLQLEQHLHADDFEVQPEGDLVAGIPKA